MQRIPSGGVSNMPRSMKNPFNNHDGETMGTGIEVPHYTRAGMDCLCAKCGKEYIKHKRHSFGDMLSLWLICDGTWVKL